MYYLRSGLICQIFTNFKQVSKEEKRSSTRLIYLIIEQYFLVKDDSKISDCCSHGELFVCQG